MSTQERTKITAANDFLDHLFLDKKIDDQLLNDSCNKESRNVMKLITFMKMCKELSQLSHDQKVKVATIIITDSFSEICSIGYNGDYSGGPNTRIDMSHGQSNFLHSEENALFRLGKPHELREKLILICTHKPCTMCAKRIVNSGIKRIIYDTEYQDAIGKTDEIFLVSNVKCQNIRSLLSSEKILETYLKNR